MKVETIDRKEIVALYQFGKMPKELDEREAEAKDHIYMPKEFMKNKETRRTYKTIVEYVKMVHEMK